MAILPVGIGPQEGGYQIERSLRFNSADSAYLSRTPASNGDRQKFTFSFWIKRSSIPSALVSVFSVNDANGGGYPCFLFNSNTAYLQLENTNTNTFYWQTTQLFRDVSAWYHIVWAVDTTQASNSDRMKLYVNGELVTSYSTQQTIDQNATTSVNSATLHEIGRFVDLNNRYLDGYLTQIQMIDGQQLDASSFGEYNTDTGVWQPKAYTGSYGTNGFYLDFADNSSTTALGYDAAGSNDWTPNNFSVTAGAGNDSLVDTPTRYGTDTGAGGEVRGNYATLNPLNQNATGVTLSNGNLDVTRSSTSNGQVWSTFGMASGKWYAEVTAGADVAELYIGIANGNMVAANRYLGQDSNTWAYYPDGRKVNSGTYSSYGNSWTAGDVIGIAFDADAGSLYFYKNGTVQNSGTAAFTSLTSGPYFYACSAESLTASSSWNFGQRPFAYTAPSGFKALCTTNLPEPTISDGGEYFNASLWTGNGSTQSITGVGFQPDLVWVKSRNDTWNHTLTDAVRGNTKYLFASATDAELTATDRVTSFDTDGFSTGSNGSVNANTTTYVAWNWKANGAGVSNTDGTITSTVSANTTSGFSIVTYTGNGSANQTVGHGLGVAPAFGILKDRDPNSNNDQWQIFHTGAGDKYGYFTTAAFAGTAEFYPTSGSSTTVTIARGSPAATTNESGDNYVMYLFAPVEGFSAMGSYVGNGSADGPFIFTGHRPRWIMIKQSSGAGTNWVLIDTSRDTYNVSTLGLGANSSAAESSFTTTAWLDVLSNGFKIKCGSSVSGYTNMNDSGATYIYAAFGDPFKFALSR